MTGKDFHCVSPLFLLAHRLDPFVGVINVVLNWSTGLRHPIGSGVEGATGEQDY
jgi:hypothetical protein